MSKLGVIERDGRTVGYMVRSPATGTLVDFEVGRWSFDGNMESPTFSPSMLVHGDECHPREHFFVRDGKVEYLPDCDHALAGKTVDMVPFDEEDEDDE